MSSPSRNTPRRLGAVVVTVSALLLISACSAEQVQRGWMPGPPGMTDRTDAIVSLWTGSWIAALVVGVIVWGLLIWAVIVYRKRKDDNRMPVQLRYHLPLELLYTFVPVVMVGVLFFYTVQVQDQITAHEDDPDVEIQVYGRQWAWDFNYLGAGSAGEGVWDTGQPAQMNDLVSGEEGVAQYEEQEQVPTLYLPVDQTVEFTLNSRDVMHSFWVPAFLYKLDMIPGRTNTFQVTPQVEGRFYGRCAELCGEYHGYMLFNVEVVSEAEYQAHLQSLEDAGQTGILGPENDRQVAPQEPDFSEEGH